MHCPIERAVTGLVHRWLQFPCSVCPTCPHFHFPLTHLHFLSFLLACHGPCKAGANWGRMNWDCFAHPHRCREDEQLLSHIRRASGAKQLLIFDCRPKVGAIKNPYFPTPQLLPCTALRTHVMCPGAPDVTACCIVVWGL